MRRVFHVPPLFLLLKRLHHCSTSCELPRLVGGLQDKSSVRSQQLNLGPNENENRVNVFSAADVTADLDGVLEQLRSGTIHGQHVDPPGQQSPRR